MGLELALLALSIAMFGAQVFAWRWSRRLERRLKGSDGYEIIRLLTQIFFWSLVARVVGIAAVAVLGVDRSNVDTTLALGLVAQVFGSLIFFGAAVRVWQISRDRDNDADPPSAQGPQALEGVGIEVDQVGVPSAVAVNDLDANAALSGAH